MKQMALVAFGIVLAAHAWAQAPTTLNDLFLPGSQPMQSGNIESPDKCDNCHGDYDAAVEPAFNWRGSMMAQAARDPLFFACLAIANQDAPESGDLCIRCHAPDGWLQGRSVPTDGSLLNNNDREGVQCDFCHKLVKPTAIGTNPYPGDTPYTTDTYPSDQVYLSILTSVPPTSADGMYIADSNNGKRGPFVDAAARHQMFYSPFHSDAALCGTCHDVSNPVHSKVSDGVYAPNDFDAPAPDFDPYSLFPVERTYSEWMMSAYNTPEGVYAPQFGGNKTHVSTCQDCHMRDVTGVGCNKRGAPIRTDLPLHDMTGGNTFVPALVQQLFPSEVNQQALAAGVQRAADMLRKAASMEVDVSSTDSGYEAHVRVTNETGHKLPSGYPEGRRIWLNVVARDATGAKVFESGAYDFETATLTHDDQAKIYEIKPGLSPDLADVLGLQDGPSFHFVVNNHIYSDNRIPPRGFANAAFTAIQSPPVGYSYADGQYWDDTFYQGIPSAATSVDVTLYYQTVSKEYVEFLRDENHTNHWGNTLYDLWSTGGKSAPVVMKQISVSFAPPVAAFDGQPLNGPAPHAVSFADRSSNGPTGWYWEFGDGAVSSEQNPTHVYQQPGVYSVSLTVSNDFGSNSLNRADYVTVDDPAAVVYMHVSNISVSREQGGGNRARALATVVVEDQLGNPIEGARVDGDFTGPSATSATGNTDAAGIATLTSRWVKNANGTWCLHVTNISKTSAFYDPSSNVVEQACEGAARNALVQSGVAVGLLGNHPNPFNPRTVIRFSLPDARHVTLEIFDVRGARIALLVDREMQAGIHDVDWLPETVPSGIYICRLEAGDVVQSRPLTLVK